MKRYIEVVAFAVAAFGACWACPAGAQGYPTHEVKLIVPFSPATPLDIIARVIAPKLGERLKQRVLVDNQAGAGNIIGITSASRAKPDGYTLLMIGQSASSITPFVYDKPPYNIEKEFTPVHLTVSYPFILGIHAKLPVSNLKEFIDYAKANPLRYGTTGPAAGSNITTLRFSREVGIKLQAVPYKGGGDIAIALQRGDVHAYFGVPESFVANPPDVRVLAAFGDQRHPGFPAVPTLKESGINFTATSWYGMVAPMGTPAEIVTRLNQEMNAALKDNEVRNRLVQLGLTPLGGSVEDFARIMNDERGSWGPVIREAGVKAE